jgi:hypothetical protein
MEPPVHHSVFKSSWSFDGRTLSGGRISFKTVPGKDLIFLQRPILRRIQVQLDWKTNVAALALAQKEECAMATVLDLGHTAVPGLHVFEQAGNWH